MFFLAYAQSYAQELWKKFMCLILNLIAEVGNLKRGQGIIKFFLS
jgi:hypothetical protein